MANKRYQVDYEGEKQTVEVNGELLTVWPENLHVQNVVDSPSIFITWFDDTQKYHDKLINKALELEQDKSWAHRMPIGGSKIRDLEEWGMQEADLLTARATEFFARATGRSDVLVTQSWANISRYSEYLTAHSHTDCVASMVYMLNWGDHVEEPPYSGQLSFSDPRIEYCCPDEPDRMTRELVPKMRDGALCIFPSELIHYVHPYWGKEQPRITVAWNFKFSNG
ncbi:MAG: hypothetical protein HUJ30_01650 [Gammaproteobacteria bacterium]|nr:hypothetical protein [Gammaproteobacteria bacterium]